MSEPVERPELFAGFGPALRELVEYTFEYSNSPRAARPLVAAMVVAMVDDTGRVDFRLIDRAALERAGCGRKATSLALREYVAEGFLALEQEGGRRVYYWRPDIAREVTEGRASMRREGLRVVPGGKRDA